MATVTGLTAEAMEAIRDNVVVDGEVVGDDLILTTQGGVDINAGNVRGPAGAPGLTVRYIGELIPMAGSTVPSLCLACDGSAVSRSTYAALFAEIGTAYGSGDGSTTFNLPNTKGRTLVTRDSGQTEFDTLGETGGSKTHTLTGAESGVNGSGSTTSSGSHNTGGHSVDHSHSVNGAGDTVVRSGFGGAGAGLQVGGGSFVHDNFQTGGTSTNHTHAVQNHTHPLTNRTADSAHNNLQPYLTTNMVIYAGV